MSSRLRFVASGRHSRANGNGALKYDQVRAIAYSPGLLAYTCAARQKWLTPSDGEEAVNLGFCSPTSPKHAPVRETRPNARALECVGLCLNIIAIGARLRWTAGGSRRIANEVLCVFRPGVGRNNKRYEMQVAGGDAGSPYPGAAPSESTSGLQSAGAGGGNRTLFGDCGQRAARMVKLAKPSQIISGGECVEALSNDQGSERVPRQASRQREGAGSMSYEILMEAERGIDLHGEPGGPARRRSLQARLCLRHGGKEINSGPRPEADNSSPRARSETVVKRTAKRLASNARIELRRDKVRSGRRQLQRAFRHVATASRMAVKREEVLLRRPRNSRSLRASLQRRPTEVAAFEFRLRPDPCGGAVPGVLLPVASAYPGEGRQRLNHAARRYSCEPRSARAEIDQARDVCTGRNSCPRAAASRAARRARTSKPL